MIDLLNYRKNIYSSEGEDGILEKIFEILNINQGSFCEFGAWDGIVASNTRNLLNKDWIGVYIESDMKKYNECCDNNKIFGDKVVVLNKAVSIFNEDDNLDNILNNTFLVNDFDLLSIDVDGYDYHIWDSLKKYKPKVVVIEIDSNYNEKVESIYDPVKNTNTSFLSMLKLGNLKGYRLLCSTGNMFFIRNDIKFPETNAYHQGMNYYNWRK